MDAPASERLRRWRSTRLRGAGVDDELADELSARADVDIHALIELVERGCPPELAARIVAPLDWEGARAGRGASG
jgi:hypothetical protein